MVNGNTYNAVIYSIDINGVSSPPSNKIVFKCYSTPLWSFFNLDTYQVIQNSSYQVQLSYSQLEGEPVNSYQISLYDSGQSLLHQSGVLYNSDTLSYTVSNLMDNTQYYIRAIGKTLNGMDLDTGYIPISVEYIQPSLYSLIQLENLPKDGSVKISYNAQMVTGYTNVNEPVYIDLTKIDLRGDGTHVVFDNGFKVKKDALIQIIGQDFNDYSVICEWSNGTDKIEIKYMRGDFDGQSGEKAYFLLYAYNQITRYVIYSNYIDIPSPTDVINVWLKRVNNAYELQCEIL